MADKKRKTRSKGISFNPPELQARVTSALTQLSDILSHSCYPLDSPEFKPDEHDETITESSLVEGVYLPSMQEHCDVPVRTLLHWADEIKHGKVFDRKEYRSPTLTLVYVAPVSDLAQIAQGSLSRRLGNFAQDVVADGNTYRLELVQGLTPFGIKIAQEGNYEDYAPPGGAPCSLNAALHLRTMGYDI